MDIDLAKEIIDVSLNFDAESDGGLSNTATPESTETAAPAASSEPAQPAPDMPAAPAASTAPQPAPVQQPMPGAPAAQPMAAPPPAQQSYYPPQPYAGQPQPQAPYYPPQPYAGQPQPQAPYYPGAQPPADQQPIVIKDYDFGDFGGVDPGVKEHHSNLELIMNVPVVVTVELGRTKRKIKEILEFGQGTVVELDKQAGSQVDLIVNGQLIARGDVVVVDDNFSIRITEILKGRDSLTML